MRSLLPLFTFTLLLFAAVAHAADKPAKESSPRSLEGIYPAIIIQQEDEENLLGVCPECTKSSSDSNLALAADCKCTGDCKCGANCKCSADSKCSEGCKCGSNAQLAKAAAECKCTGDCKCGANCKCTADNKCRAWTYARPGYVGKDAHCFLKKEIKPPRRKAGFTSGVVR